MRSQHSEEALKSFLAQRYRAEWSAIKAKKGTYPGRVLGVSAKLGLGERTDAPWLLFLELGSIIMKSPWAINHLSAWLGRNKTWGSQLVFSVLRGSALKRHQDEDSPPLEMNLEDLKCLTRCGNQAVPKAVAGRRRSRSRSSSSATSPVRQSKRARIESPEEDDEPELPRSVPDSEFGFGDGFMPSDDDVFGPKPSSAEKPAENDDDDDDNDDDDDDNDDDNDDDDDDNDDDDDDDEDTGRVDFSILLQTPARPIPSRDATREQRRTIISAMEMLRNAGVDRGEDEVFRSISRVLYEASFQGLRQLGRE